MKQTKLIITVVILLSTAACTTHVTPPDNAPTMAQAYEKALRADAAVSTAPSGLSENVTMARQRIQGIAVSNQITVPQGGNIAAQFPMLPNPQLIMYITPHYAGSEQLPVPGYYTVFPLYQQNYYALAGEAPIATTPVNPS